MLPLICLLPWLGMVWLVAVPRASRDTAAWAAALADALALAALVWLAPAVFAGEVLIWRADWVASLGLSFSFRLDGLSFLFAFLILAIGLLVVLYARYYLSAEPRLGRFYALLLLFTGAMLGVALSNNLLLLFVFWELTSISSFLLIGYWNERLDAREGARVALAITGGGGLAMLAGLLLLGSVAGSFELDIVLRAGDTVRASPLYLPALLLILLGAFTKSAQVPFHFWLPAAMAAPTPVSAYLHSATMVKAGVFLLARLYPVLAGSHAWFVVVSCVGLATFVFAAWQAVYKHDLKGLLAYSTISHLGLITLLLGMSTPLAAVAAVFHLINHATFKASLFMAAGIIDHETGTRDMRRLNGLWRYMPYTAALAMVAAGAMAGVPLLNGFLSKEMFFGESLTLQGAGVLRWVIPLGAVVAGVFSVAYSARFIHDVFFNGEPRDLPRVPHEPPRWMRIPVDLLVGICLLVGMAPALTVGPTLDVAVRAVLGAVPEYSLAVWHGFNLPLAMSAVALLGGAAVYVWLQRRDLHAHVPARHTAKRAFDRVLLRLGHLALRATAAVDTGSLRRSAALLVLSTVLLGVVAWRTSAPMSGAFRPEPASGLLVLGCVLCAASAAGTAVLHRHRLLALILLSAVGLLCALGFLYFSAPDLALTQLAVETVSVILLLLALYLLPQFEPRERALARRVRDAALALAAGAGVAALAYAAMILPLNSISGYFLENSVPKGGGSNVVNVILVDFRAFDTFGEITVIGIAALGIAALLAGLVVPRRAADAQQRPWAEDVHPLMLQVLTALLLPLALLVSLYIFLRGHNDPGGGFVAGLITAVALILQYVAGGVAHAQRRLRLPYAGIAAAGLLVAGATGLASAVFGAPFLTGAYRYVEVPLLGQIPLASAMLFDLGVYLTVLGSTLLVLSLLGAVSGPDARAARAGAR